MASRTESSDPTAAAASDRVDRRAAGTREAILDAAERLFAQHGLDRVSLREIGVAAGQRNRSAVQYHFKNREAVVLAIIERRTTPLHRSRMAMLETIELAGRAHDIRALIECMVIPDVARLGETGAFFRFSAQLHLVDRFVGATDVERPFTVDTFEMARRIGDVLGSLDPKVAKDRFTASVTLLVDALATQEALIEKGEEIDRSYVCRTLVDMIAAILLAPDGSNAPTPV